VTIRRDTDAIWGFPLVMSAGVARRLGSGNARTGARRNGVAQASQPCELKSLSEQFPSRVAAEVTRRISWRARAAIRLVTSAATIFQTRSSCKRGVSPHFFRQHTLEKST